MIPTLFFFGDNHENIYKKGLKSLCNFLQD